MRCSVLGAGSWGTALAAQLARQGHDTVLWDRNSERCEHINTHHRNPRYLRGEALPQSLRASPSLEEVTARAELLVPVLPSHALRQVVRAAARHVRADALVCSATKGIEDGTLLTMAEVLRQELPEGLHRGISILSGPSFALELTRGLPTVVVVAGPEPASHTAAEAFHGGSLRAYDHTDQVGVCMGGSLKNVLAIATGLSDGLGLGDNARAAIITRGLAEITRLAVAAGAEPLTMMGLAGMGDLVLTCTGDLSRNRRVGLALGRGRSLDDILAELGEVAEGVLTTRSAHGLAMRLGVEMPITQQMYAMLYQGQPGSEVLGKLLGRARRTEREH